MKAEHPIDQQIRDLIRSAVYPRGVWLHKRLRERGWSDSQIGHGLARVAIATGYGTAAVYRVRPKGAAKPKPKPKAKRRSGSIAESRADAGLCGKCCRSLARQGARLCIVCEGKREVAA